MRLTVVLLAALGAAAWTAPDAAACSCLPWGEPRTELARADGAFVGVFLGRRPLRKPGPVRSSVDPYVYVFRVERRVKGRLPRDVEVISPESGASCGLEVTRRQRVALLLERKAGRWHSTLCQQRPARFFRGIPSRALATCR